jgi:hypothetical protein
MKNLEEYRTKLEQMSGPELFGEKERLKSIYSRTANDIEKWNEGQEVAKVYIDVQYKRGKAKFGNKAVKQSLTVFYR